MDNKKTFEERIEDALNELFNPLIKYFESKECMLAFKLIE